MIAIIVALITATPATVAAIIATRTHRQVKSRGSKERLADKMDRHIRQDDSRYTVLLSLVSVLTDPSVGPEQKHHIGVEMLRRADQLLEWDGTERRNR